MTLWFLSKVLVYPLSDIQTVLAGHHASWLFGGRGMTSLLSATPNETFTKLLSSTPNFFQSRFNYTGKDTYSYFTHKYHTGIQQEHFLQVFLVSADFDPEMHSVKETTHIFNGSSVLGKDCTVSGFLPVYKKQISNIQYKQRNLLLG